MSVVKICEVHGKLIENQCFKAILKSGNKGYRCKICTKQKQDKNRYARALSKGKIIKPRTTQYNHLEDKERKNGYRILYKYKLPLEKYKQMLKEQNNLCAICGMPETRKLPKSDKVRSLTIDHNHETGEVRGLLCHHCNVGIGHFKDDIERLQKGIDYLKSFTTTT